MPTSALKTPDGKPGLATEYFADTSLSARVRSTVEPQIKLEAPGSDGGQLQFKVDEVQLVLDLPAGKYAAEWIDTRGATVLRQELLDHAGGPRTLLAPAFEDDVALAVQARP